MIESEVEEGEKDDVEDLEPRANFPGERLLLVTKKLKAEDSLNVNITKQMLAWACSPRLCVHILTCMHMCTGM